MQTLSREERIYGLSLIWKEAEYNFAFWDKMDLPDWDEAYRETLPRVLNTEGIYDYYFELMRFLSLLQDGHTGVWFPEILYKEMSYLPIEISYITGKHVMLQITLNVNVAG